ncbi:Formate dehydrogenase, gamma subunit [Roseovarius sp. EC-HK134]|jgi:formate dehydrogenase subunit gamma|uniref:Formate dehydrogenase, cytochrome b556(Fdo) subunit n=1 Tax=Roseovarius mucosus TaxID=215743 RepID=A0A1V0RSI1_9RHOB|nr:MULTISPECIES: formate dehydrogenase subunit gamma [Roseovarius]ARE84605.1 formate dehydrogenase, cytochrome b556(fdo) subunit [Roseovarius mucosus]AWZ20746.1 Formate dehydrogenase -O, gamma subunit [Roseovarius sp. AK1035]EDM32625.1 Formate dehydrogenase, gamma subunit [Roseovarius sp. TM1035]MBW4973890.1 formate dehydrogenase subunit gamma [Roseovarius mucosus]VVT20034.1 Formate dehydrogenase, gamma subunit [Roseovarius sp. EC-SD190]
MRAILSLALCFLLALPAMAQDTPTATGPDRSATGGAQTLDDILARQRGEQIDDSFRRNATGNADDAAGMAGQLGTLGGASDAEVWRALRYGLDDVKVSAGGPEARVLIQDGGMTWLEFRKGPLATYGAYLLGGTLVLLALFYLVRGKIRIDGAKTGRTVTRFQAVERFGHWLMAGSFVVLAITGLVVLFGRTVVIPLLGHEAFATIAVASKWVHNNISWAFMLGLVMVFFMWVLHNIPNRTDLKWLAVGGGIFSKGVHPPAKKFNAGQKMIFWAVIVFGASISATGLSLLFPFEMPMFAKTFVMLNQTGLPQAVGFGELPVMLAPHEEMQLATLWHSIMAFVLTAIILAHIYIGSVGMEGAFDAMGSGEVEEQWAREHHGLWLKELQEKGHAPDPGKAAHPAE